MIEMLWIALNFVVDGVKNSGERSSCGQGSKLERLHNSGSRLTCNSTLKFPTLERPLEKQSVQSVGTRICGVNLLSQDSDNKILADTPHSSQLRLFQGALAIYTFELVNIPQNRPS